VVGSSCGRQTNGVGVQVLDPVGVGILDAASAGMAAAVVEQVWQWSRACAPGRAVGVCYSQ
jgi:hypothetical protein